MPIVEEHARPDNAATEGREIGPPVAIEVAPRLAVVAAEHGPRPGAERRRRLRVPTRHVAAVLRRRVEEEPRLGLPRPSRDEIDDAAERRRAVQRRCDTFDDFDLAEVQRRHLQQAEQIALRAVQRQTVGEQLRIASPKPLDPDVRRAERRRGGLHAQARRFVDQHRHAAWRHHRLLVDLLLVDDFDSQRLILQPRRGSRGGDEYFFLQLLKLDRHSAPFSVGNDDHEGRGKVAVAGHGEVQRAGRDAESGDSGAICERRCPVRHDRRTGHRLAFAAHFHSDLRVVSLGTRRAEGEQEGCHAGQRRYP